MTEAALLQWLIQGGFAALFIWLFVDTRREARSRENESQQREEKLTGMLEQYATSYERLAKSVERTSDSMIKLERRLDQLSNSLECPLVKEKKEPKDDG
jgi:predicted RNase H-like nuclease (RuvC/YqgF family)